MIDADALADASCHGGVCAECDDMYGGNNVVTNCSEVRLRFLKLIKDAPTIEERKRGEWIEDAETFYKAVNEKGGGVNEDTPFFTEDDVACSECLTLFNVLENRTDIFDFCPHCGADMRGEQDE